HRLPAIRSAGFLYLLIAHLGALAILLCFGVMNGGGGDYTFDALRAAELGPQAATLGFLLAFFGFGAKAGMLPLHAWLPEAHPAAPSPVSALMSGIMIKTAIYGMVRVIYDLIGGVRWEWGLLVLAIGAATTLFGVLYALMQHDLKRLLAYHSVENIGIILLGLLAISALPPLNGFVSEWLTFQTALQAPLLEHGVMRSLVPLFAATLALAGALTAMCFVKVYGIAFLGQPREARHAAPAPGGGHDAGALERIGMAWLAAGCFVLGLLPGTFVQMLDRVSVSLSGGGLPAEALESSWLWLVPTAAEQASYSPVIFLSVIVAATLLAFLLVRGLYHGRVRYSDPWDCGYPERSSRMQDTADA